MLRLDVDKLREAVARHDGLQVAGKLRSVTGLLMTCTLPAAVGDLCEVRLPGGAAALSEVIGFSHGTAHLLAYEQGHELHPGLPVVRRGRNWLIPVGDGLLGRTLDGLGRPIDGKGELRCCTGSPVRHNPPAALERSRIDRPFVTGQRAVDGLLTLGRGQRVGIFAGSGVGKSTLLGEIARGSDADVNVIALIGERGREVRPFLDDNLGPEGMARSVVIVATCDQTPLMRVRAGQAAITVADHFRRRGANVLFMLDSLTRLALAQREIGLSLGEPPSARGYTPSVFQLLANTVEGLGTAAVGSITGVLTVLVDGGDLDEPISDAVRSLVDGHLVLDRRLAERGHYPAIHVGQSVSRTAREVQGPEHARAAAKVRAAMATYAEAEDLIRIGAYVKGSSPQIDRAVELQPVIQSFLRQEIHERTPFAQTRETLKKIAEAWPF